MDTSATHDDSLQLAGRDKRFVNYLIDSIVIIMLAMPVMILLEQFGYVPGKDQAYDIFFSLSLSFIYYTIIESFTGITIGKILTGTMVVDEYGQKPAFKTILVRSLCRQIPFNALSFLFLETGWHDLLSGTRVIIKPTQQTEF